MTDDPLSVTVGVCFPIVPAPIPVESAVAPDHLSPPVVAVAQSFWWYLTRQMLRWPRHKHRSDLNFVRRVLVLINWVVTFWRAANFSSGDSSNNSANSTCINTVYPSGFPKMLFFLKAHRLRALIQLHLSLMTLHWNYHLGTNTIELTKLTKCGVFWSTSQLLHWISWSSLKNEIKSLIRVKEH